MERKYHGLKKTIIILAVVAVLLVAAIVYCQIRIKNVKANEEKKWQDHLTSRQEELDALQAEYDAKGYDATKDELLNYCRKHIAKYAMPYDIEFREELPKTLVGKVAYRVLEDEEKAKLAAQAEQQA